MVTGSAVPSCCSQKRQPKKSTLPCPKSMVPSLAMFRPSTLSTTSPGCSGTSCFSSSGSSITSTPDISFFILSERRRSGFSSGSERNGTSGKPSILPSSRSLRKCFNTEQGMMYPMFCADAAPWKAIPTTFPPCMAGPPLLPGLIAASTCAARSCLPLWL